jgi:Predicted membrane protein (DUF2306)
VTPLTLDPLLRASPAIQVHAFAAMSAFVLGAVQLAAPKGTLPHRTVGWIWISLMLVVSISAFFIHELRLWGAVEPDPSAGDFHAGDAADRGVAGAPARGRATSSRDSRSLPWRPGDRRLVYIFAGSDHARGAFRGLMAAWLLIVSQRRLGATSVS